MSLQGFIKKTSTKEGKGKRGTWVRYAFLMELDDGQETAWISGGFDKPPFAEGSYGTLEIVKDGDYTNYVPGTWKVLPPPAAPAKPAADPGVAPKGPSLFGAAKDASIQYQSSRKDALALVALLLEHDALPISAASAKAGVAKRYEEIKGFVDKLTVEFYGDIQGSEFRVVQSVVDAGATKSESGIYHTDEKGSPVDND